MNISRYTSLILKLIGVIFILSFLVDLFALAIPFRAPDPQQGSQWQINFVTQLVDRGVVPMVGMAFIIVGYWVDSLSDLPTQKASGFSLKIPVFALAIILGLVFLLAIPVHASNVNRARTNLLQQIEQGAGEGEQQIQGFLTQINDLSRNPQQLNQQIQQRNQVIESGQFQGRQLTVQQLEVLRQQRDQLQQLRNLAQNPQDLKKRLDEIKNQLQTRLADQKREQESRAQTETVKQALRIALSSFMLTVGYFAIGVLGFRGLGGSRPGRSKAPAR